MPALPRLSYLTSLRPVAFQTFILRTVTELRLPSLAVRISAARQPKDVHLIGPEEEAVCASTFHLMEKGKSPAFMVIMLAAERARPRHLVETLRLAFRAATSGLKGTLKKTSSFAKTLVPVCNVNDQNINFADPARVIS